MRMKKEYTAILVFAVAIVAIGISMSGTEAAWKPLRGLYVTYPDGFQAMFDTKTDKLITEKGPGQKFGWPAHQYNTGKLYWAGNCCEQIHAINTQNFKVACKICTTASGKCPARNFGNSDGYKWARIELAPDGKTAIAQVRDHELYPNGSLKSGEPSRVLFIDSDSKSPTFCSVLVDYYYDESLRKGPNDVTISLDGKYVYIPDIHSDTITVMDINTKVAVSLTSVPRINASEPVKPSANSISPQGDLLFVENAEGSGGSLSVFDVATDPINPAEIVRFVQDGNPAIGTTLSNGAVVKGGLGLNPQSDEFTGDNKYSLVINRGSADISVVNTATLTIDHTISLGTPGIALPEQGDWTKNGKKFYVGVKRTSPDTDKICHLTYDTSQPTAATKFSSATCINTPHFKDGWRGWWNKIGRAPVVGVVVK